MNTGIEEQAGDSEFERRTRVLLLDSADALSGAVRSRLTQARHAALGARAVRLRYRLQRWVPAGAAAAAALAMLVVFVPHTRSVPASAALNGAIEDIDLLTSDVPLNADQDVDYEFYEWAVDEANGPTAGAAADAAGAAARGT